MEYWSTETIARHLGLHHRTVFRALGIGSPVVARVRQPGARRIDPYLPFVKDTLAELPPRLPASVLYRMVCERGYGGG